MSGVLIRLESESDESYVEEMTRNAFWNVYEPGADEHYLIHIMRKHPDFVPELNFVAEIEGKVVGHIIYTRATVKNDITGESHQVVLFGPLTVDPDYQKQGIGSALVKHSANVAKSLGIPAIVIFGNPRYYGRLGFRSGDRYDITNEENEYCLALQVLVLHEQAMAQIKGALHESVVFTQLDPSSVASFDERFPPREKIVGTPTQLEFQVLRQIKYKAIV